MITDNQIPSEQEMLTFDDVRREIASTYTSLLLGNGFSIAYNRALKYNNLKDEMLKIAFNNVTDVEKIMHAIYVQPDLVVRLLKRGFITAIGKLHPQREDDKKIALGATFLNHFIRVYTLNYDAILYWVINSDANLQSKFKDGLGFKKEARYSNWPNTGGTSTFYLHGSLLLNCSNADNKTCPQTPTECCMTKYKRPKSPPGELVASVTLTQTLKNNLEVGKIPHFVSEGNYNKKYARIKKCTYLKGCYDSLTHETENLVTYGVSFKNDQHILEAIKNSKVKCCYIGIYSDDSTYNKQALYAKAKSLETNSRIVKVYKAETAKVWHE